jgi:hypothetical protein
VPFLIPPTRSYTFLGVMILSCPDTLPAAVGAVAAALAQNRTDEELALLAAVFTQLGDSLALILVSRACAAPESPSEESTI